MIDSILEVVNPILADIIAGACIIYLIIGTIVFIALTIKIAFD